MVLDGRYARVLDRKPLLAAKRTCFVSTHVQISLCHAAANVRLQYLESGLKMLEKRCPTMKRDARVLEMSRLVGGG